MAAWSVLKAALLAAAAGAYHVAAGDAQALALRADIAARRWMATAADVFDQHLPDKRVLNAAATRVRGGGGGAVGAALAAVSVGGVTAVAPALCMLVAWALRWLGPRGLQGPHRIHPS